LHLVFAAAVSGLPTRRWWHVVLKK
jgi:hypothetical protein